MPRKPIELPLEVAKAFVKDMRAFFAAGYNTIKADEIANLSKIFRLSGLPPLLES
jgi:hypothetical protein